MKIWLDDLRDPPDSSWRIARSYAEFRSLLCEAKNRYEPPELISFDHDLGNTFDGYDCIKLCSSADFCEVYPVEIAVHSMNPIGADNIRHHDEWFRRYREQFMAVMDGKEPPYTREQMEYTWRDRAMHDPGCIREHQGGDCFP